MPPDYSVAPIPEATGVDFNFSVRRPEIGLATDLCVSPFPKRLTEADSVLDRVTQALVEGDNL